MENLSGPAKQVRFVAKLTARGGITLSREVREVLDIQGGDIVELEIRQVTASREAAESPVE